MLGVHRRLVRTCERLTDFPNFGDFPHMSQTWAIVPPGSLYGTNPPRSEWMSYRRVRMGA